MRLAICGQFFLDLELWLQLRQLVVSELLRDTRLLRVWSVGCHVGKEPFSVAMMLDEVATDVPYSIIASDYNESILDRARRGGPFNGHDLDNVSQAQLERYFRPGGPPHYVLPSLLERVTFVEHDVRGAALDGQNDLILFRNIEPFFAPEVTRSVYRALCATLRPGGILFVGTSDELTNLAECGVERIRASMYRRQHG